ncbi:MAG: sensor histidine kinase, partial [Hansschlegelia sp.]
NLVGLVVLVSGILFLNQFRAGLIEARVQSLLIQGEIIAGAIASSATVETNQLYVDPDKLLELQLGQTTSPGEEGLQSLEFPINPERVAPVLRRLVTPTRTRARIYDRDGALLLDSRSLYARGDILRFDLPAPRNGDPNLFERIESKLKSWFRRSDLPLYSELGASNGRGYPEVTKALSGSPESIVRVNDAAEIIVSVAVPIQRFRAVTGVLLLSTQGGDIDAIVSAERYAIVRVFLVAAAVMLLLSLLLASTIAGPVRKLADGAELVRHRVTRRAEIPDFTNRSDEIGHLSGALRDMTNALYARIESIERFAADVAHELKNPLTSLRSAVETLPLAKSEESKERLLAVIQHDVRRLDRLISDISDASRLDAELQRQDAEPVDVVKLLTTVIEMQNGAPRDHGVTVTLNVADAAQGRDAFLVLGHDSRLAQVVTNLVDNARSFSPPGATVKVTCRRVRGFVEIVVDDVGAGIRPDAMDKIFERFYTDRPEQGFGQNSGLGLSISKQIVEAQGGRIRAENRVKTDEDGETRVLGARFVVRLSAALT